MHRSFPPGALPAILLIAALPSQAVPFLPTEQKSVHVWPEATAGQLRIRAALPCRLTPGRGVDLVVLRSREDGGSEVDRSVFLFRDFARAHAAVPLGNALDVAVLPGPRNIGDIVLTLAVDGTLRAHRWPEGAAAPVAQVVGWWPGFRALIAVHTGSTTEVFAIDAATARIRRATWTGASLGSPTQQLGLGTVHGIAAMDWDQDGNLDLVLNTAAGLLVQRWNQTPLAFLPLPGLPGSPVPLLTCVSRGGSHGDLLATVVWDGMHTLVTWGNASTAGSLVLGPLQVAAIAAYDRDGDGDQDLLLADADHNLVHVLLREPGGFVRWSLPLLVGAVAPDTGLAAVAGIDLDGDGDGDVMAWNEGSLLVHTAWDALAGDWRPQQVEVDLHGMGAGPWSALPLSFELPPTLRVLPEDAIGLRLLVDGWATAAGTGIVQPARLVQHEVVLPLSSTSHGASIPLVPGRSLSGGFHIQLHVAFAVDFPGGLRRVLPSRMLHVTTDPELEESIRALVAQELLAALAGKARDGGGDGNILGGKTGKHVIGEPPQ